MAPTGSSPPGGRRSVVVAGHLGDEQAIRASAAAADPGVRASALGALVRCGALGPADLAAGLADPDPVVRRRACEEAGRNPSVAAELVPSLHDADPMVVEAACWALGERDRVHRGPLAVETLAAVVTGHPDPLCREAAVAALGAIGDPAGLDAVVAATVDKPAVRRRAVLALAPFEGPEVDAVLSRALEDRDWQVRQAAEDLLS